MSKQCLLMFFFFSIEIFYSVCCGAFQGMHHRVDDAECLSLSLRSIYSAGNIMHTIVNSTM